MKVLLVAPCLVDTGKTRATEEDWSILILNLKYEILIHVQCSLFLQCNLLLYTVVAISANSE